MKNLKELLFAELIALMKFYEKSIKMIPHSEFNGTKTYRGNEEILFKALSATHRNIVAAFENKLGEYHG